MADVIKDSILTFFKKLSNSIKAIPSKVNHYVHTNPKQVSYGMVFASIVGVGLMYVEDSEPEKEEEEEQEEQPIEKSSTEEQPIQGGSRRRKNHSKKTRRQRR